MARTEKLVHAPAETVFAVLCDPRAYDGFVVGTKRVRRFDPRWPEPGTALHHTVGIGPFALRDRTESTSATPPNRLVVRPHVRPFMVAETIFTLEPRGDDTLLRIDEYAIRGPLRPVWPGPLDGLMSLRNRLVARRIARRAERRHVLQHEAGQHEVLQHEAGQQGAGQQEGVHREGRDGAPQDGASRTSPPT